MKKKCGLSDMIPKRFAAGGLAKNDEFTRPVFNPGATFTGSPRGSGLESKGGQFTAATAQAANPAGVAGVQAPRTVEDARMNGLSAFLGGNIAPTTPQVDIPGTPVQKPAASMAPVAPIVAGDESMAQPGLSSMLKTGPLTPSAITIAEPAPRRVYSEEQLNALNDTVKYGLPTGETVGYSGKLNFDANRASRNQLGRDATDAELVDLRNRLHYGGETGLSDLEASLNSGAEGQEFNLMNDPLNDEQFIRRAFRSGFGREARPEDLSSWGSQLAQGQDRRAMATSLRDAGATNLTDEQIDELIAQGDAFAPDLQGDETENIIRQHFTSTFGRDPTDYELARYASGVRGGRWSMNPGANSLLDAFAARRAGGWAKGGRVRVRRHYGGPTDEMALADGGRVTNRDRFIEEQVSGKQPERTERAEVKEKEVVKEEMSAEERALLEKYRRKGLGERLKSGLSSLLR